MASPIFLSADQLAGIERAMDPAADRGRSVAPGKRGELRIMARQQQCQRRTHAGTFAAGSDRAEVRLLLASPSLGAAKDLDELLALRRAVVAR
jgi:hypothetical protein